MYRKNFSQGRKKKYISLENTNWIKGKDLGKKGIRENPGNWKTRKTQKIQENWSKITKYTDEHSASFNCSHFRNSP